MENSRFDFLSGRLIFIDITTNKLVDINIWHHLSVFENHVYGVYLQYKRIKEDLNFIYSNEPLKISLPQAGLDIYYYILTWDKLKKIYEKIKIIINKYYSTLPNEFKLDFRDWKRRIDHLFKEYDEEIRNEYEHPSMESYTVGNFKMWGNIIMDSFGNIKAHVGRDYFASIKKEHTERLYNLRIDLFDIFLKYFSQKPLTQQLLKIQEYIESNIDSISNELLEHKKKKDLEKFNNLIQELISTELYLSREGIKLSGEVKNKIYSFLFLKNED